MGFVRTVDFEGRGSDYGAAHGVLGVEFTITREENAAPVAGMHICFAHPTGRPSEPSTTPSSQQAEGMMARPPGLRTIYHVHYYAAFVLNPDSHRIEAACHSPARPAAI